MNPMLIALLAGTAMGAIQGQEKQKQEREDNKERQRRIREERERQRYAWFTGGREGATPATIKKTSTMNEMMKGGMAGAMFGQGFEDTPEVKKPYEDTFEDTGMVYDPGKSDAPYREGALAPEPSVRQDWYDRPEINGGYNGPMRPIEPGTNMTQQDHELSYTAQGNPGRRVSSPGAVGNFYPPRK